MGQLMWVRVLPDYITEDANGGVSTAEPEKGVLKANIRGNDWKWKCNTAGETICQC
jgi:hypothetical protein